MNKTNYNSTHSFNKQYKMTRQNSPSKRFKYAICYIRPCVNFEETISWAFTIVVSRAVFF